MTDPIEALIDNLNWDATTGDICRPVGAGPLPMLDLRARAAVVEARVRVPAMNMTIEYARLLGAALLFAADMAHIEAVRAGIRTTDGKAVKR